MVEERNGLIQVPHVPMAAEDLGEEMASCKVKTAISDEKKGDPKCI